MGNAEFKGLSHVSPVSIQELLAICGHAISSDELVKGTESSMDPSDPWCPINRTQFSLLFESSRVPFQLVDQLFDAYTVTMRELGGEEGLRRPDAFTKPLSAPSINGISREQVQDETGISHEQTKEKAQSSPSDTASSSNASPAPPIEEKRKDLNEETIQGLEMTDPLARTDFIWLVMHLFAVLPHSAPMALVGDIDKGLRNISLSTDAAAAGNKYDAHYSSKTATKSVLAAQWLQEEGARRESASGEASEAAPSMYSATHNHNNNNQVSSHNDNTFAPLSSSAPALIPVDHRLSLLYDFFLRRVQRKARIKAEADRRAEAARRLAERKKRQGSNNKGVGGEQLQELHSPIRDVPVSGGPANTPTKLALIKSSRGLVGGAVTDAADPQESIIPRELTVADVKDALFATTKLAVARFRGVGVGTGRVQHPDRRCAGCHTIPTNLTYDCQDCHTATGDRYFKECANLLKSAVPLSPRSGLGGGALSTGRLGGGGVGSTAGQGPLSARTDTANNTATFLGNTLATVTSAAASSSARDTYSQEQALMNAAAMTAPVHVLGLPITTLLCNRCVGQYEGYGSGLYQERHLRTHAARRSNWAPNPQQVTHIGTECSACGLGPITGTRFRCLDCLDRIDLCEACYRDAEEPLCHSIRHRIWKITVPLTLDEEVNSFTEEIVAPLYEYLGIPLPRNAVTRRINANHRDKDFSEQHNEDFTETHFTDALLTVDQQREVEQERLDTRQLVALKEAALRIASEWPQHVSNLLDEDRTLAFLEAQERGEHALEEYKREMMRAAAMKAAEENEAALRAKQEQEAAWEEGELTGFAGHNPAGIGAPLSGSGGVGHNFSSGTVRRSLSPSTNSARGRARSPLSSPAYAPTSGTRQQPQQTNVRFISEEDVSSNVPFQNNRHSQLTQQQQEPRSRQYQRGSSPLRRPLSAALQAAAEAEKVADGEVTDETGGERGATSVRSSLRVGRAPPSNSPSNKTPEDIAAGRLAKYYATRNSDEHTYVSKDMFILWGNQSEVIAALFRGFEVRYATTCTEIEGVEYAEYSSSMATGGAGVGPSN